MGISSSHWNPSLQDDIEKNKNKKKTLSLCLCYTDLFSATKGNVGIILSHFKKKGFWDKAILNHLTAVENVIGQKEVTVKVKMNLNSFESEIFFTEDW